MQTSWKFLPFRKDVAFPLIDSQKDVLESKKTDVATVLTKKAAWAELAEQFNAVSGMCKRDSKQLQCWWENQEKRARQNIADNRVKTLATGSGPCSITFDS